MICHKGNKTHLQNNVGNIRTTIRKYNKTLQCRPVDKIFLVDSQCCFKLAKPIAKSKTIPNELKYSGLLRM